MIKDFSASQRCFDLVGVIIVAIDTNGKVIMANKKACRAFGYESAEIVGKNWFDNFIAEDSRGTCRKLFSNLLEDKVCGEGYRESLVRVKTGEERLIAWRIAPVCGEDGEITAVISSGVDITEQRRAENAIKQRYAIERALSQVSRLFAQPGEADIDKALKALGEALTADVGQIVLVREESKIKTVHNWRDGKAGASEENPDDLRSIIFEGWLEKLKNDENIIIPDLNSLPGDASAEKEKEFMRSRGLGSFMAVPVRASSGAFLGFMGFGSAGAASVWSGEDARILRVVGETISSEQEKKRVKEEMALRQAQLLHADKMKSLGVLVSGVAHEINNPNNFIMLSSQTLTEIFGSFEPAIEEYFKDKPDGVDGLLSYEEAREMFIRLLSSVTEGSQRIKRIVDKLKGFSRQNVSGYSQLVDINKVVESSIRIVDSLVTNSTNRFSLNLQSGLPIIKGNFQELEQVMINLVTNSCQSLPDRDRAIKISSGYDPSQKIVIVEVADEGEGITPENLGKITDPFFTTKCDSGGTGLGLSVSRNIMTNHKGNLEFSSRPGQGAMARVTLPV